MSPLQTRLLFTRDLSSDDDVAYIELTIRGKTCTTSLLERKKPHGMAMVFVKYRFSCSSVKNISIMVYIHADIQRKETSDQSILVWFSLGRSNGNAIRTKQELRDQSAEKSLQYSFIWDSWCRSRSHLGLSHLQVRSLSSSWRSLQYASECLQEQRQVAGSCTNNLLLLSEQLSQQG